MGMAVVDYDCTVEYPPGWEGDRLDRVDPKDIGGNCGNTGPNRLPGALVVGGASAALVVLVGRRLPMSRSVAVPA
jgi:hypothetical protein